MLLADFETLWKKHRYAGDNTLESAITYLSKTTMSLGLPAEVIDVVMQEVFLEMAGGRTWPLDGCDPAECVCPIKNSGTAIIHDMERRIRAFNVKWRATQAELMGERLNASILRHITEQNQAYLTEQMQPTKWQRTLGREINLPNWLSFLNKKVF
jgi:hypothetical protein